MTPRHLKNAPITEALLDIRVELPATTTLSTLESVHRRIAMEYPTKRTRAEYQAEFNAANPSTSFQHVREVGFMFWSADEKQAVQARFDGFSFSRLAPYGTWEELRAEARRQWDEYRTVVNPVKVTRIALRYINRLSLPQPAKLQDYLLTFPQLGTTFPDEVSGLLMRVVSPRKNDTAVVVTEAIDERSVSSETLPIILDIDTFRRVQLPVSRQDECWGMLDDLRGLKNDAFFGSITDKAGELFV